jgi:hypothetical protein
MQFTLSVNGKSETVDVDRNLEGPSPRPAKS